MQKTTGAAAATSKADTIPRLGAALALIPLAACFVAVCYAAWLKRATFEVMPFLIKWSTFSLIYFALGQLLKRFVNRKGGAGALSSDSGERRLNARGADSVWDRQIDGSL